MGKRTKDFVFGFFKLFGQTQNGSRLLQSESLFRDKILFVAIFTSEREG